MKGINHIYVAKAQAEAMLGEPRLVYVCNMLRALVRDSETPCLPRHIVERQLAGIDTLIDTIAKHGGLVK